MIVKKYINQEETDKKNMANIISLLLWCECGRFRQRWW